MPLSSHPDLYIAVDKTTGAEDLLRAFASLVNPPVILSTEKTW